MRGLIDRMDTFQHKVDQAARIPKPVELVKLPAQAIEDDTTKYVRLLAQSRQAPEPTIPASKSSMLHF